MRASLLFLIAALPLAADAAPKKTKAAVPAVPAVPAASATAKPAGALIDSDLGGREMTFLSGAIELGKTFRYLASQVPRTANPALRGFGEDLVKTLAAQSAVLNTVAEMRKLKIPEAQGLGERRIAEKLEKAEGIRLEKMLLDAFREADVRAVAIYEMGAQLDDQTIRRLSEQTLPQFREHLVVVDAMAGIAPKQPPGETVFDKVKPVILNESSVTAPEPPPVAAPPRRPAFRAKVIPQGEPAPVPER